MRIAIAASEPRDTADVNSRAARAPYLFIYDGPDDVLEMLQNPFDEHERAMGARMADFLAGKGVEMVIAGHFGSGFVEALSRKGMRWQAMDGTVREAARAAYAEG